MSTPFGQPPAHVPTLTEVVVMPEASTLPPPAPMVEADIAAAPSSAPSQEPAASAIEAAPSAAEAPAPATMSDDELIQHVLANVQHQIELMLDYRLREALAPILTRATDAIVRDARAELASTLRDVITRAVAQESARHRDR